MSAKSHSIFEKSVNCIETINGASVDVDAARFQWHIGPLLPLFKVVIVTDLDRRCCFLPSDNARIVGTANPDVRCP
jgi:hypothetical protein